jgi:hypothetical protein
MRASSLLAVIALPVVGACASPASKHDSRSIDAALDTHRKDFHKCFDAYAPKSAGSGSAKLFVAIGHDGKVTAARLKESTIRNPSFEGCLTSVVRSIEFPPFQTESADRAEVIYPIKFSRGGT